MKFLDLCAGIGGIGLGMEQAGHECVGYAECDTYCSKCKEYTPQTIFEKNVTKCDFCGKQIKQFARMSYEAIHETEGKWTGYDVTKISNEEWRKFNGTVNVICAGFPCQAFSIAGSRRGFEDTRGTVFFEIARAAREIKPQFLFLENVKGLLNHDEGNTFRTMLATLNELGYDSEWSVCNSKYFGVAQNRERTFIVGHLRGERTRKVFPFARESGSVNQEQPKINIVGTTSPYNDLSKHTRERTFGIDGLMGALTATDYKTPKQILIGNTNPSGRGMNGNVFDSEGVAPTITTNKGEGAKIAIPVLTPDRIEKQQNGRRFKDNEDEMFNLTAQDRYGVVVGNIQSKGFKNNGNIYSTEGIAPTVTTRNNGDQGIKIKEATKLGHSEALPGDSVNVSHPKSTTRRGRVGKQIANTLLTGEEQAVVVNDFRIRKLTTLECFRLQAFPDELYYRAKYQSKEIAKQIVENNINHYDCEFEQKMSDSQLYKQAGNGVTVTVIYEIAKRLSLPPKETT